MFPGGMNPKQMQKMLKRMGIRTEEIDAERVIIECTGRNIIINDPQVILTRMSNQEVFQISGEVTEEERSEEESEEIETRITEEDIAMVAEQAGVGEVQAKEALIETRGDIAEAILKLKESKLDSDAGG